MPVTVRLAGKSKQAKGELSSSMSHIALLLHPTPVQTLLKDPSSKSH